MKDMKEMTGVTFNGSVTFNGPMFDIHDNDHVTIVNSEREGKTKTQSPIRRSTAADGIACGC